MKLSEVPKFTLFVKVNPNQKEKLCFKGRDGEILELSGNWQHYSSFRQDHCGDEFSQDTEVQVIHLPELDNNFQRIKE